MSLLTAVVFAIVLAFTFALAPMAIARGGGGMRGGGGGFHGGGGFRGQSVGAGGGGFRGQSFGGRTGGFRGPAMSTNQGFRSFNGAPGRNMGNMPRTTSPGGFARTMPGTGGDGQFASPNTGRGSARPGGGFNRQGQPPTMGAPTGGTGSGFAGRGNGNPGFGRGNMAGASGTMGRGPGQVPGGTRGQGFQNNGRGNQQWHGNQQWRGNQQRHGYHPPRYASGQYFYPGYANPYNYGFWSFSLFIGSDPYLYSSPFAGYGFPYVYAPAVQVVQAPAYTYAPVPSYGYGNGYYMSPGYYTGLDAAVNDIRTGWTTGNSDLILKHVDEGAQIAIYVNGDYSYSLPGKDYGSMVRDVTANTRTTAFTVTSLQQRSDGAYTLLGRHDFYDANNTLKSVAVSYTLAQSNGNWAIVAAGSSESGS